MNKYVTSAVSQELVAASYKLMSQMGFKEVCVIVNTGEEFNECIGEIVMRVTPFDRIVVLSLSSNMVWNGESEMTDIFVRPYEASELTLQIR